MDELQGLVVLTPCIKILQEVVVIISKVILSEVLRHGQCKSANELKLMSLVIKQFPLLPFLPRQVSELASHSRVTSGYH